MTKFADQLYEDLMREHGAELRSVPEPGAAAVRSRRRAARPAWLTAGLLTATAAAAGGFVLFGGAASPAYAVTRNANGTVSVAVKQASAIDAANARLKAIGVRVVIVPVRAGCPDLDSLADQGLHGATVGVGVSGGGGQVDSITVDAQGVPADDTLVLAFEDSDGGAFGGSGIVEGKVPGCVTLPTPPTAPAGPGSGGGSGSRTTTSQG